MPILTPSQVIIIGFIVAPGLFALSAYFTRANLRRTASALVGVVAFGLVQYAWDRVAAVTGWWSYPAYGPNGSLPMPVAIYIFSGLVYAGFGLVGWRIARHYGWTGLLGFLIAWSLWGFIHDTVGSALFSNSRLMVLGSGPAALVADFLVYAICMTSVLLAIRVIGGPFWKDKLARAS
jgi:hypothetical protein